MTEETVTEKIWRLPNRFPALIAVVQEVFDWTADLPMSPRPKYSSGLAVEEVFSNVIKYGYDDADEHEMSVQIIAHPQELEMIFEDDGHAFDPTGHPQPDLEHVVESRKGGGLGIELLRRISKAMEYARVGNKNRLTLHINRFEPSDTQTIHVPLGDIP